MVWKTTRITASLPACAGLSSIRGMAGGTQSGPSPAPRFSRLKLDAPAAASYPGRMRHTSPGPRRHRRGPLRRALEEHQVVAIGRRHRRVFGRFIAHGGTFSRDVGAPVSARSRYPARALAPALLLRRGRCRLRGQGSTRAPHWPSTPAAPALPRRLGPSARWRRGTRRSFVRPIHCEDLFFFTGPVPARPA